jgi:hypothetical protein
VVFVTIEETVGQNVHELIWRKKLGHRPLYTALGITRFTLAKKLRGDIGWSASDIATTAEVLGVEPGRLFKVTGDYRAARSATILQFPIRTRSWSHGVAVPA